MYVLAVEMAVVKLLFIATSGNLFIRKETAEKIIFRKADVIIFVCVLVAYKT